MRKLSFMIFIALCAMRYCYGQNTLEPKKLSSLETKQISEELSKDKKIKKYEFVDIKLDQLKKENITIRLFDKEQTVNNIRVDIRNENNFSWFGKGADGITDVVITVLNNEIYATIANHVDAYKVITKSGVYVAIEEYEDQTPSKCGFDGKRVDTYTHEPSKPNLDYLVFHSTNVQKELVTNFDCGLRVLIMYTAAAAEYSNIDLSAQHCIDQLNQSFINSDVAHTVQLAGVMPAFYEEEENMEDIRDDFFNPSDGKIDHVFDIMDLLSADISVLLTYREPSSSGSKYDDGYVGFASKIKACAGEALAVVDVEEALKVKQYTFSHEIGHLLGCRHDTVADASDVPYSYGHGFWNSSGTWSTLTASNFGAKRILYWSNPSIIYDATFIGNASCNEAQVVRDNVINAMTFRESNYTRYVATINIPEHLIYNAGKIWNNALNIPNAEDLTLIAGKEIKLTNGFKASAGSEFLARILQGCGSADGLACNYGGDSENEYLPIQENDSLVYGVTVFPNPADHVVNISWEQGIENGHVTIKLLDINGREVDVIVSKEFGPGKQRVGYTTEYLSAGVYIVSISTAKYRKEITLIKLGQQVIWGREYGLPMLTQAIQISIKQNH